MRLYMVCKNILEAQPDVAPHCLTDELAFGVSKSIRRFSLGLVVLLICMLYRNQCET